MINRIDKVELFLVVEGINKTVEVLTDLLLIDADDVFDIDIKFGQLSIFARNTQEPVFRLPYDVKSVTLSSPTQKDTGGTFFSHSLSIQIAGTKADVSSEIELSMKKRYFIFFKSSVSGWQLLPTYVGADFSFTQERFPKRSTIRLSCQSLHHSCSVPDAVMDMILTP